MGLCIPGLWIPHRGKQAPLEQVAHWPEVMSTAAWQSPSGILALSVEKAREGDAAHGSSFQSQEGWWVLTGINTAALKGGSGGLGVQQPGAMVEPWTSLAAPLEKCIWRPSSPGCLVEHQLVTVGSGFSCRPKPPPRAAWPRSVRAFSAQGQGQTPSPEGASHAQPMFPLNV